MALPSMAHLSTFELLLHSSKALSSMVHLNMFELPLLSSMALPSTVHPSIFELHIDPTTPVWHCPKWST